MDCRRPGEPSDARRVRLGAGDGARRAPDLRGEWTQGHHLPRARRADGPHGIAFDRDGKLLVAEDSRRVRRVDPTTGDTELVVDGVDTNRLAVAEDGTLFLAGATRTGGTLRRLTPAGRLTLLDRVDAETGTRTRLAK